MTDAMNVAPWPPFLSLFFVTTGQTLLPGDEGVPPEERLTRLEALRSYSSDCAWFLDLDGKVGTLEAGSTPISSSWTRTTSTSRTARSGRSSRC